MELNKEHRSSLISKLDEIKEAIFSTKYIIIDLEKDKEANSALIDWTNIDLYIMYQQLELIKKALTENEIDF